MKKSLKNIATIFMGIGAAVMVASFTWSTVRSQGDEKPSPQMIVLVDTGSKAVLGELLYQYKSDAASELASEYGTVRVIEIEIDLGAYFPGNRIDDTGQNKLTVDIARKLKLAYQEDGLVGIVIVGDIPIPRAYNDDDPQLTMYPWVDFESPAYAENPTRGRFERTAEEDPHPEIWHGVIREPGNPIPTESVYVDLDNNSVPPTLRGFFEANHQAHTGNLQVEPRVLLNDLWAEEQRREITKPDGSFPDNDELPGGAEIGRRDAAARFAQRLMSTGRYDGVNFADDYLPKGDDDQDKTVAELLDQARGDGDFSAIQRWRDGDGSLKQIDVASQVILYFDHWTELKLSNLDSARAAANNLIGSGFDLYSRDTFDFCNLSALPGGQGYFSLPENQRAAVSSRSGFASRKEFEFVLLWTKIYTDGEKRMHLVRDGVPPFGRYGSIGNTYDLRLTIAPGNDGYELNGARLDGNCFQRGMNSAYSRGGTLEVLLGAPTAKEVSGQPVSNIALWTMATGVSQAAIGNMVGPSLSPDLPDNLGELSRDQVSELVSKIKNPGFNRLSAVKGTAEKVGFEQDSFILSAISGQPLGEVMRVNLDSPTVFYGDPTIRIK